MLWQRLWELLRASVLQASLGQPALSLPEDGHNSRHASLVTGQVGTQSWQGRKTHRSEHAQLALGGFIAAVVIV